MTSTVIALHCSVQAGNGYISPKPSVKAIAFSLRPVQRVSGLGLALQLHFSLEVRSLCFGLVSASPERPCDNASGLDAALHELEGDTTDFLDRPADQERRLIDRRGNVFLGPTAAALAR